MFLSHSAHARTFSFSPLSTPLRVLLFLYVCCTQVVQQESNKQWRITVPEDEHECFGPGDLKRTFSTALQAAKHWDVLYRARGVHQEGNVEWLSLIPAACHFEPENLIFDHDGSLFEHNKKVRRRPRSTC